MSQNGGPANCIAALEFYSGIGGMHAALQQAQQEAQLPPCCVRAAFDINGVASAVYAHNHGSEIVFKVRRKQVAAPRRDGSCMIHALAFWACLAQWKTLHMDVPNCPNEMHIMLLTFFPSLQAALYRGMRATVLHHSQFIQGRTHTQVPCHENACV